MKQIEIDSHIGNWFNKREALRAAEGELSRARDYFQAATEQCARQLVPQNASKEERYIFPTTDGRAVVAWMKEQKSYGHPDGKEYAKLVPTCDEHKFK